VGIGGRLVGLGGGTGRVGIDSDSRRALRTRAIRIPRIVAKKPMTSTTPSAPAAVRLDEASPGSRNPKSTRNSMRAAPREGPPRRRERRTLPTSATMKKRTISGKSSKARSSMNAQLTVPGIVGW
jgi:hypothetical protein